MSFYALIPAKLNSKSIPNKNLKKIGNKSLLDITIQEAKKIKEINEVIVSSESLIIKDICKKQKISFFKRNKLFSNHNATSAMVINEFIKKKKLKKNDVIVYLQPTSPLRKAPHIREAIKMFKKNNSKNLISVKKITMNIYKSLTINSGYLKNIFNEKYSVLNRQNFPSTYVPNGAIYIFLVKNFLKKKYITHNRGIAYIMNETDSIDIDEYRDLLNARKINNK